MAPKSGNFQSHIKTLNPSIQIPDEVPVAYYIPLQIQKFEFINDLAAYIFFHSALND